jgi:Ser/Thr protein kinase RdoA (MazF antagonist)
MGFVPGTVEIPTRHLDDAVETMASAMATLHELGTEGLPVLPLRIDPLPELYDYLSVDEAGDRLRGLLERTGPTAFTGEPVLLHGDFWPGNLLWQDGELLAILDWEDAAIGDPAADLAGCRLELTWKFGAGAAARFTESYRRLLPVDGWRLALWEIYVASAALHFMAGWGLPPEREAAMRSEAKAFVQKAEHRILAWQRSRT